MASDFGMLYKPMFRAPSLLLIGLAIGALVACGDGPTHLTSSVPAALLVEGGDAQSGAVGAELPSALVVRVVNAQQQPIPNQIINFRVVHGGGSVFAGAALTNSEGIAQERWTLGTVVTDSQVVEARAVDNTTGNAVVFARFVATALPGAPATLTVVSGNAQSATTNTALPLPVVVRVHDQYGNVVPGATVEWAVITGAGTMSTPTSLASAAGDASVTWTLGSASGPQLAQARSGTASTAELSATALPEQISLEIVAGNAQIAPPSAAVAIAPAVRTLDGSGTPRSGVPVTFAVTQGGGVVSPGVVVSDQEGIARADSWTLGSATGSNSLSATSPSGATAIFTAMASPASATLVIHAGNNQTAVIGTSVALAPAVRVTDAQGVPVAGVSVVFEVGSGGGSITLASAVSDAAGVAQVGSWTLGGSTGTNTLLARLTNGATAVFTALAYRKSDDISVSITHPSSAVLGDTVYIQAAVASTNQLASVTAYLGGVQVTLAVVQPGVHGGTAVITGLPRDTLSLIVRATDINGAVTEAVRAYTHDRAPRIAITLPSDRSTVIPALRVVAACDDDDASGCLLTVRRSGAVVAGPAASIDVTLAPLTTDAHAVLLEFSARDSRNQVTQAVRRVFVVPSANLQHIASIEGEVLDLLSTRLLAIRSSPGDTFAIIANFQTGARDTVPYSGIVYRAALTPEGAAFSVTRSTAPYARLYLRRGDAPLITRTLNSASSFAARGSFVIYTGLPNGYGPLYRFNTATGLEDQIAASSGNSDNGVAENGDVAYWAPYNIFRYRAGTTTAISTDDGSTRWNTYPLTDGSNVVFRRHPPCCANPAMFEIALWDGTSISVLATHGREVIPERDYQVYAGWTAFTRPDASGQSQVWTRSPAGALRQVSTLGSHSHIVALGADGSVVFDNGDNRYHAGPSSAAVRVNSTLGRVVWRDNRFVVLIGSSAFALVP